MIVRFTPNYSIPIVGKEGGIPLHDMFKQIKRTPIYILVLRYYIVHII